MFKRAAVYTLGAAVASGGPIAYYAAPDYWESVQQEWSSDEETAGEGAVGENPMTGPAAAASTMPSGVMLEGPPVKDLTEVFNLNVTPYWIQSRWPRVSVGLKELQLQGYRVMLVTGTEVSDLAGSLTYYFNAAQQAQRLEFDGWTGDVGKLIGMVKSRYGFTRRLVNDPGLYIYESVSPDGKLSGILRVETSHVLKAGDPHSRFRVKLLMNRTS